MYLIRCLLVIVLVNLVPLIRTQDSDSGSSSSSTPSLAQTRTKCYDDFLRPRKCIPGFENAAYNIQITATNTCGEAGEPQRFCMQTETSQARQNQSCDYCYPNQHNAKYLTDFHSRESMTWWQSETMLEGIQYPNQVNLTLNLGKAFDITYIRLWFFSPRPESFAIFKRTTEDGPWSPYQFYSATCKATYNLPDSYLASTSHYTKRGEESTALCTSEYSDISPLQHGNVAFSTLEARPSAYNFEGSPELQEFVTATDIRIVLDRLNAFGDQVFGGPDVFRTYYYAVADIAVGARCKCNGHASECITSSSMDGSKRRVCKCEHNTAGPDCNECLPFYNDAPWARASEKNANECRQCNCNGFSNRCFFDRELYDRTGHGGHCLDCTANRDGPNCERCKENYYQRPDDGFCVACNCDAIGSRNLQCNSKGTCQCKPGVTGEKCDRCDVNHYDFGQHGCKNCGCSDAGSVANTPTCDTYSGTCHCKENVEGKRCKECKPGFFNLDLDNDFGCTPCFCYGHSSECIPAPGYSRYQHESVFARNNERWGAVERNDKSVAVEYDKESQTIRVAALSDEAVYFVAPERYLGDQRASYNQILQFTLRIGENTPVPMATDITIEGSGAYITNTIFAQRNPIPATQNQVYKFRLHEHQDYGWQPRLSARAFMSILTNLTAIKIRGTYTRMGSGYLDDVHLETASRGVAGRSAYWIEQCECPTGYVGQFCESCAPGFRHSPSLGGPFMPCIPCDCNKHADICDSETGRCICQHHTTGDNCDLCARGYYGNALTGSESDCSPCGCPNGGACIQLDEDVIMCVECPLGYTGHRCDSCSDGFFGDPEGKWGDKVPCDICECNLNVDTNAIGNCNTTTGECLKCVHNTGGVKCGQCLEGFYGDALALPKGNCKPCQCYPLGTDLADSCDQITGACHCLSHVQGRNCDECEPGYFNIGSAEGCEPCNCDTIGSLNKTCDINSGQCLCQPGVTGLRCDQCEVFKYGFSASGCIPCDCDPIGSKALQCDSTGQCPCLDNVEGRRCERCKENKFDRQRGCVDCPDCYNLVQSAAHEHTSKLEHLKQILDEIERNPTVIDDDKFETQLKSIDGEIKDLLKQVKTGTGGVDEKNVLEQLTEIEDRQTEIAHTLEEIEEDIYAVKEQATAAMENITHTGNIIKTAEDDLADASEMLNTEGLAALAEAKKRAIELGQHSDRMTDIAQESRTLADDMTKYADDIKKTAADAKTHSNELYDLAKATVDEERNMDQKIAVLENMLEETEVKLSHMEVVTEEAHKRAKDNKNQALTLLNDAKNLKIPNINLPELKVDSDTAKVDAIKLLNDTDALIAANFETMKIVNQQLLEAKLLLEEVTEYEDTTAGLLSAIDLAKAQAKNAVDFGDKTLNEAKATYETLSHFDKMVKESKEAAEQALLTIPHIEQLIDETINTADAAQDTLNDAKAKAISALEKATVANELAGEAAKDALKVKQEVDLLNKNATGLKKEAEFMSERINTTLFDFEILVDQTNNNGSLINEAKDKVGRAAKDTEEASKKVNEIMQDIKGIVRELENLPQVDEAELDELDNELKIVEQRLKDANFDSILEQVQKDQREQSLLIDLYTEEIRYLTSEVENIEAIAKSLPDGCFKRMALEP